MISAKERMELKVRCNLRRVDEALCCFGPRRALQKLNRIMRHIPAGHAGYVLQYRKVLEGMLDRKDLFRADMDQLATLRLIRN